MARRCAYVCDIRVPAPAEGGERSMVTIGVMWLFGRRVEVASEVDAGQLIMTPRDGLPINPTRFSVDLLSLLPVLKIERSFK